MKKKVHKNPPRWVKLRRERNARRQYASVGLQKDAYAVLEKLVSEDEKCRKFSTSNMTGVASHAIRTYYRLFRLAGKDAARVEKMVARLAPIKGLPLALQNKQFVQTLKQMVELAAANERG